MGADRGADRPVLMVYVEPAPYILALIRAVAARAGAPVESLFIEANASQPWHATLEGLVAEYLPPGTFAASRAIARRLRERAYGLLHLAGWGHPVLMAAMVSGRLRGLPIAVESDSTMVPAQPWRRRAAKALLYPAMLKMPTMFLPGGTRQKRYLQRYGVPESRIAVAQMTVDVDAIARAVTAVPAASRAAHRAGMGVAPGDCQFLFVGRLTADKGVDVLIDAFARASAASPHQHLHVVGDGPLRDATERAQQALPRVRCSGRLSGDALTAAYAAADVLVLPSRFEPWGLVVNEAMAAGLPVIASARVGCVDDLVVDGRTGLVVQAVDADAVGTAMVRIAGDAALRAAMGAAARRLIADWTIEAEADCVVAAWHRAREA